MKGLILKDFYLLLKYCRMFLFFAVICILYMITDGENMFFQIYPVILVGMMPLTLYSYDEREHWCVYSQTLPVSKRQYVTAKYVVGFLCVMAFIALTAAVQFAAHGTAPGFLWKDYLTGLLLLMIFGLITQVFTLPFLFKFGAEKGRLVYILVIVILSAAMGTLLELQKVHFTNVSGTTAASVGCLLMLGAYIGSWLLSVKFYEKREM